VLSPVGEEEPMRSEKEQARNRRFGAKIGLTMLVLVVLGTVVGIGTWSAFSGTTQNTGNTFQAGTVVIGDNDGGSTNPLYTVTNAKPGTPVAKCIKVTYTGSLDATVKLYSSTTPVPAASQYVNLTVEKGTSDTSTFPDCGTFSSEATIFSGTLQSFMNSKTDFASGVAANPGSQSSWSQNNSLVYRFTVDIVDSASAQGANVGSHTFTWEAQNT
jgi:hypothetical protein